MTDHDLSQTLQQQVERAYQKQTPLLICGSGSKTFYGRLGSGQRLELSEHRGIIHYAPSELVITARAGTPLKQIEAVLAEQGQQLPFEPPHFGDNATLGGAVASGLSGPARPYRGALRDHLLGCKLINGKGEILHFGGEVMKNVAGYDVTRLMAGAMGTLGVLLEVSVKVLPKPSAERTLCFEMDAPHAIEQFSQWAAQPLPISAASHFQGIAYLRLSGTLPGVAAAAARLGGEPLADSDWFWQQERELLAPFFSNKPEIPLWRLSLPPSAAHLESQEEQYLSWGGAQRWLRSSANGSELRQLAAERSGHALLFRGDSREADNFPPLPAALLSLHQRIKKAFDPNTILNPGRLYKDL